MTAIGAELARQHAAIPPTGPVPPSTRTRLPPKGRCRCAAQRCLSRSRRAAAAVVYAPLGSAKTDTSNGGTIALRARSSMSAASDTSRPPMKMPVRPTPFGPREKIASCVRPATLSSADVAVRHDDLIAGVGGHVHVERAHLRVGVNMWRMKGRSMEVDSGGPRTGARRERGRRWCRRDCGRSPRGCRGQDRRRPRRAPRRARGALPPARRRSRSRWAPRSSGRRRRRRARRSIPRRGRRPGWRTRGPAPARSGGPAAAARA